MAKQSLRDQINSYIFAAQMQFSAIPGHTDLKQRLTDAITSGRIPHAQLFLGREGCGNLALAIAYAQFLSCTDRQPADSCGKCPSCIKYNQLIHPDLHFSFPFHGDKDTSADDYMPEWRKAVADNPYMNVQDWMDIIKGENKQPNINIREIRSISRRLSLKSFESEYKVLILWLPEYLGNEGNVLLKLIEEPPANTVFILVAQNADRILTTILSRTQLVKVRPFSDEDIITRLTASGTDRDLAGNIAHMSEGSMNRAIALSAEMESPQYEQFRSWMLDCYQGNVARINSFTDGFIEQGREKLKSFLTYGLHILRAALIEPYQSGKGKLSEEESTFVSNLTKFIHRSNGEKIYKALNHSIYEIERNGNPKLVFINLSLELRNYLRETK